MNVTIRCEVIRDYNKIAEINALAFSNDNYVGEVAFVDVLRHGKTFDNELSLVAEINKEIVGHVLFYPYKMLINGKMIPVVCLGPIAIHPKYQKCGIGGKLIEEGHKISKNKGYKLSFLFGHPSYYPRFDYIQNMFGYSKIMINRNNIRTITEKIVERPVTIKDIEILISMWKDCYGNIDLSLCPTDSLLDWITHSPLIRTSVITINGETKGYLRYNINDINDMKIFLAKDKDSTLQLISYIKNTTNDETINLPIHPNSEVVKWLKGLDYEVDLQTWDAGMIKVLDENDGNILEYCNEVKNKKGKPGHIILPPSADIA